MPSVTCAILGGGRGTRLYPLTKERSKPAVPLAGRYRLVDVSISNCLNSGYGRVYVITQFNTESLHRHVSRSYPFDAISQRSVEILAAQQTMEGQDWYQGTADAVRQNLRHLRLAASSHLLVLSGDHLYRMDYRPMIAHHDQEGADATIACLPVTAEQARSLGVLKLGARGQVCSFAEKPKDDRLLEEFALPEPAGADPGSGEPLTHLASMGVYVFAPARLREMLERTTFQDFGHEIIPWAIANHRVTALRFDGYWEDIGTISAFYQANLALTAPNPRFPLHVPDWPLYTRTRHLPPSRLDGVAANRAVVAEGATVVESELKRTVVGLRSQIAGSCRITDSVILGYDYYRRPSAAGNEELTLGEPALGIGRGCQISGALLDKNVRIGEGVTICGSPGSGVDRDGPGYHVRDGIVVIPREGSIPAGARIEA
jgi:glucose-1-phosphate adenylyltransferase